MRLLKIVIFVLFVCSCKNGNKQTDNVYDKNNRTDIVAIEAFLESQSKKDSLNGAILIADGDDILLRKAYGFKDLNHSEKHSVDSKIGLASMPKMFTAICIMKLKSQHKIDLDASLGDYLPTIKNHFLKDSVTVRALLSHTSGLGNYWDYTDESDQGDLDKLYQLIIKNDAVEGHGNFRYSNSGFIVLGKIIESITGISYKAYVENNILKPLEMTSTSAVLPDGGSSSTLDDLMKFSKALRDNLLVSKESLDEMITKQSEANYGLGFQLNFKGQSKIYGHPGGSYEDDTVFGIASALDIIDNKYTVIVLTNRNPGMGGAKARSFILDDLTSLKTE